MPSHDFAALAAVIVARFPDLAGAPIVWHTGGWHSIAADVADRWIFKFPRHAAAERALRTEASLLAVVRPAVTLPVPALEIFSGPPVFSRHAKLRGSHLLSRQYEQLSDRSRARLAADLARFHGELHALDRDVMRAAGASPIEAWLPPDKILRRTRPLLPAELLGLAERTISAWAQLPPDPHGTTYGFFDGHGWNMAFDHGAQTLTGVYDFADSGFGPVHHEFIYASFVSPDLTSRIASEYERLTGRVIDRQRVELLTGVHRLWELAALADDAAQVPAMLEHVRSWASHGR